MVVVGRCGVSVWEMAHFAGGTGVDGQGGGSARERRCFQTAVRGPCTPSAVCCDSSGHNDDAAARWCIIFGPCRYPWCATSVHDTARGLWLQVTPEGVMISANECRLEGTRPPFYEKGIK